MALSDQSVAPLDISARARGSVTDAETDGRLAVELCTSHDVQPAAMIPAALVPALLERGRIGEAQQLLERARVEGVLPDAMNFNLALFARARLRLDQGRIGDAIDDLHQVGARYEQWGIGRPIPPWRSLLARAYWAKGDEDEARQWAERELVAAGEWGTARAIGVARVVLGLITSGAVGIDHLRQAADTLEDSPGRLELAHALVELGAALRRANQRANAREPLGRGMTLAAQCGADALAQRGAPSDRRPAPAAHALGARGAHGQRATNRRAGGRRRDEQEIAQALFVSTRTVETHVRHALQKLNITSRQQLAEQPGGSVDPPNSR